MSKKVTIKDISKQTGVSIATVSHVINHTRYVSPELVEKVERCIRETGYDEKIANKIPDFQISIWSLEKTQKRWDWRKKILCSEITSG